MNIFIIVLFCFVLFFENRYWGPWATFALLPEPQLIKKARQYTALLYIIPSLNNPTEFVFPCFFFVFCFFEKLLFSSFMTTIFLLGVQMLEDPFSFFCLPQLHEGDALVVFGRPGWKR